MSVRTVIDTGLGPVVKTCRIAAGEPAVRLTYRPQWSDWPAGSFRLGNLTLNAVAFDTPSLFYARANGGRTAEEFYLAGTEVNHGDAVSFLVSARYGLGVTSGRLPAGDCRRFPGWEADNAAALMGLVRYRELPGSYFCRQAFAAGEMDETRRPGGEGFRVFRFPLYLA